MRKGHAEDLILPVGVGQAARLVLEVEVRDRVIAVVGVRTGGHRVGYGAGRYAVEVGAVARLGIHGGPLVSVEHIYGLGNRGHAEHSVVGDARLVGTALLGGHEYYAAGASGAVDGGCGCVLEHLETLYVARVYVGEGTVVARHSVYDVERFVAGGGGLYASHAYAHVALRLAAQGQHLHARHLRGHRLAEIRGRLVGEVLRLDAGYGGGQVAAVLNAVAYHHRVFKKHGVQLEYHVRAELARSQGHGLTADTYAAYREHGVRLGNLYGIIAFGIGHRSVGTAFEEYVRSHHRFTAAVAHLSAHRPGLG